MSVYTNETRAYGNLDTVSMQGDVKEVPVGNLMVDVGASGLKRSVGTVDEEFLPALRGRKAVGVFKEMDANDPTVGALIFTITNLLRQIDWTVVGDDNTPESAEAVQFLEECMDDMSHSWSDLITEISSMFVFGWSWHEIVYKKRVGPWETDPKKRSKHTDGRIGWRKMPIRSQETLHRWLFDEDGGVQGMVQIAPPTYQQKTMSIQKSLLFRTSRHKDNPEGRSILRNAYRPWYFKKRLEEFEAIGVERDLAGLPMVKIPAKLMDKNATPEEKQMFAAFKKLVSNVRRDEHEGIVMPSDVDPETKLPRYEFELLTSGGTRTFNTTEIIGRCAVDILSVVLADFIKLGHEGQGSYAMHVDKTGIFRAALNSYAKQIADVFNRHAVPRLFKANNWKLDKLPRIEPSNVDPPDLAQLGQFMTQMAGLGMTFFPDPDLDKYLRETAHLPKISEDQEEMQRQMADQQNAMSYMDSSMQAQGMQQQHEMVQQGMSPEQAAQMASAPTPEMIAADPSMQMQQQQGEMDLKAKQQGMELDAQGKQQELSHKDQLHQQTLAQTQQSGDLQRQQGELDLQQKMQQMQLEIEAMQSKMGMEQQGQQADLKHRQALSDQELKSTKARSQQELRHGKMSAEQEMKMKGRASQQDLRASRDTHKLTLAQQRQQAREQQRAARQTGSKDPRRSTVKKTWEPGDNPFRRR